LETGPEASFEETVIEACIGCHVLLGGLVLHGFGPDGVAVIVVENHEQNVAETGRDDEGPSLISVDLARVRVDSGIAEVCFVAGDVVIGELIKLGGRLKGKNGWRLRGVVILAGLILVAFDHGRRARGEFADALRRESGDASQVVLVQGLAQSGQGGRAQGGMSEGYSFSDGGRKESSVGKSWVFWGGDDC
jgi:hypothetical protein